MHPHPVRQVFSEPLASSAHVPRQVSLVVLPSPGHLRTSFKPSAGQHHTSAGFWPRTELREPVAPASGRSVASCLVPHSRAEPASVAADGPQRSRTFLCTRPPRQPVCPDSQALATSLLPRGPHLLGCSLLATCWSAGQAPLCPRAFAQPFPPYLCLSLHMAQVSEWMFRPQRGHP